MIAAVQPAARLLAIDYPAGWNLVSGSEGSRLLGATGNLHTWQPGDSECESYDARSTLHAGWGYWAYFPNGGRLEAAPSSTLYEVNLQPGEMAMVGNPSAFATASTGGTEIFTHSSDGYVRSLTLQPGQGARAIGTERSGGVELIANGTPRPTPRALIANVNTVAGLKAAALNANDLAAAGYVLLDEPTSSDSPFVSYGAIGTKPSRRSHALVNALVRFPTVDMAQLAYANSLRENVDENQGYNVRILPIAGIGEDVQAYSFDAPQGDADNIGESATIVFREGAVVCVVWMLDLVKDPSPDAGLATLDEQAGYARLIDGPAYRHRRAAALKASERRLLLRAAVAGESARRSACPTPR